MKNVYHELTIMYMKNSLNLTDIKDPEKYMDTYLETYNAIKSRYESLCPPTKNTKVPKRGKMISKGI